LIRAELSLKQFRLILFPILALVELAILILALIGKFYSNDSPEIPIGYTTPFGWILAGLSILIIVGYILIFLTSFTFKKENLSDFFHDDRKTKILTFVVLGLIYGQIITLAITQLFYTFLYRGYASMYLVILGLSLILPILLSFIANSDKDSEIPYVLSPDTPMRLKITAVWLTFLSGAMLIFSVEWSFIVIGFLVLFVTIYFFFLSRHAVVVVPSILLIHTVFSAVIAIVSLINKEEFMQELISSGGSITDWQVYTMVIAIFIIPGVISLGLAQSFFRKWLLKWIREVRPEPKMEIELELAD
jgi:hypothetical protein